MNIANALQALSVTEWVVRGEPTNESEFNAMFRKVVGADANGSAIESSDPADFGVTWTQVKAKYDELVAAEPMRQADAKRKSAYIAEADPLFFKAQRGEATMEEWQAKVQEIKARYPK